MVAAVAEGLVAAAVAAAVAAVAEGLVAAVADCIGLAVLLDAVL